MNIICSYTSPPSHSQYRPYKSTRIKNNDTRMVMLAKCFFMRTTSSALLSSLKCQSAIFHILVRMATQMMVYSWKKKHFENKILSSSTIAIVVLPSSWVRCLILGALSQSSFARWNQNFMWREEGIEGGKKGSWRERRNWLISLIYVKCPNIYLVRDSIFCPHNKDTSFIYIV